MTINYEDQKALQNYIKWENKNNYVSHWDFPGGSSGKEPTRQYR